MSSAYLMYELLGVRGWRSKAFIMMATKPRAEPWITLAEIALEGDVEPWNLAAEKADKPVVYSRQASCIFIIINVAWPAKNVALKHHDHVWHQHPSAPWWNCRSAETVWATCSVGCHVVASKMKMGACLSGRIQRSIACSELAHSRQSSRHGQTAQFDGRRW